MQWLSRIIDVRKGERRQTAAMFLYIFIIIATLTVTKSVRQAIFLQKFGAADLPYVYLSIALVAGTIATIYQRLARNTSVHRMMIGAMLVVISNLLIFRAIINTGWGPLTYIFYVWVAIYGILATVQFWTFANYLYDPRQAKRLFTLLGVGATLGGVTGGYITQFGAPLIGTENLLFVCGVLLAVNVLIALYVWQSQKRTIKEAERARRFKDSTAAKAAGGFALIWQSRYLKLVMLIIALSIIISTVIDNQFGFVVAEHIPDKDAKTAFFGQFFSWLGWASFLIQFLLTGRLMRRFGIGPVMLILPAALFFGSGLFVLIPLLTTGLLVKIADGSFRYTTHKASLEQLYLPVPIEVKNKTKAFIDMFTDRFSKGIAAVLILIMTAVLGYGYTTLSWILMGLSVVWIAVAILTRAEYVRAFRDSLLRRKIDEDALIISRTDASTIGALAEALEPGNPMRVEKTLETIAGVKSPEFVAPLLRLAHGKDEAIALRALERLGEQEDPSIAEGVADLLATAPIPVATRAMEIICSDEEEASRLMSAYLQDERPRVRLAGVLCAARMGDERPAEEIGADTLEKLLKDPQGDPTACSREIAGVLAHLPLGDLSRTYVARFLASDDLKSLQLTIAAAGRLKSREFVEPLIKFLENRHLRYLARQALAEYGETVMGTLEDYLEDTMTSQSIRQAIPRVLERIPTQRAVRILINALNDPDERVRFAVLRALGRVRAKHPELDFSSAKISERLELELHKAYRYAWWNQAIDDSKESGLLRKTLREKSQKTIDRLFRLLAMNHPPAELYSAFRALHSPNVRIRANAIEYLDNILKIQNKNLVLGLVEHQPSTDGLRRGMVEFNEAAEHWPQVLKSQTAQEDDWLAACALYTVWATRQKPLYTLFDQLSTAGRDPGPLVAETARSLRERMIDETT